MNIALVIERMDAAHEERAAPTTQLADALSRAGHDVTVLCQAGQAVDGVELRELPAPGLTRRARLTKFSGAVSAVAGEYDIVHAMLPLPGANVVQFLDGTVPGRAAADRRRRGPVLGPLLAALAPLCRRRKLRARLETAAMADRSVLVLPASRMVADEIDLHYSRRDNVRVLRPAVTAETFSDDERLEHRQHLRRQLGLADDEMLFLTVAEDFVRQGVAETIEAFGRWYRQARRRGRLVVIGRDRIECEGYVRHAAMRDLGQACVFLSREDGDARGAGLARWYAAADVNVLLSWYDPSSRAVLEAAALGVASITTVQSGAGELLTDGTGVVVDSPRDTNGVVAAMHTLTGPAARTAAREKCLALRPKLTMQQHVLELLDAYKVTVSTPSRTP